MGPSNEHAELPNPPYGVFANEHGAFQLQLNWLRPDDTNRLRVERFVIRYREAHLAEGQEGYYVSDGRFTDFEVGMQPDPGRPLDPVTSCSFIGHCTYIIKQLKADTMYQFAIASKTALAVSRDSALYQARTLMFGSLLVTRYLLLDIVTPFIARSIHIRFLRD